MVGRTRHLLRVLQLTQALSLLPSSAQEVTEILRSLDRLGQDALHVHLGRESRRLGRGPGTRQHCLFWALCWDLLGGGWDCSSKDQ